MSMANQYIGKIILIDRERGFGFIESDNPELHIFFPKSSALAWNKLEIYDEVQFEILTSTIQRHFGKPYAGNVVWPKGYVSDIGEKYGVIDRWVGKMAEWDGQRGYIEVSTLSKRVYLKHTTLAHCRLNKVGPGTLFVVNPVKSTKPHSEYFALFAYPLNLEANPEFLQEAWEKNDEQVILDAIEDRLVKTGHTGRLWQLYCGRYVIDLGEAERLQEIVNMIDRFRRWGFEPGLADLDKAAGGNGSILLTLWFREKTKYFKPDEVSAFFKSTGDDLRDQVLSLADEAYRIHLLTEYGRYLAAQGQLSANTPRLRYLLKTAKGYGDSVWDAVWDVVETYLEQLSLENKIQLWALGLFKDLDLAKFLSLISLKNTELWLGIIKRKSEEGETLTKVILDLFLEKTDRNRFDDWHPCFIPVMRAAAKKWPESAASVRPRLRQLLTTDQLLTLGLLGLDDYLEEHADFREAGGGRWPMYALVRYALIRYRQGKITPEEIRRLFLAHGFSAERLRAEIPGLPWSQVLQPCRTLTKAEIDYEIGYLEDVSEACNLAGFPELRVFRESSLATCIFESVKTMEVFHARLWLNDFIPRDYYDYQGFREPFKKLTREEKRLFVQPSQEMMEDTVDVQVVSEIPPCHDYKENGKMRVYLAKLKNIHFEKDKFQLKTPGGFTNWATRKGVTYGFNFLSGNYYFDKFIIEIHVRGNDIVFERGLDRIIDEIVRSRLNSSMLNPGELENLPVNYDEAYPDDLQLQEKILYYLKEKQDIDHKTILINPHIFEFEYSKSYDQEYGISHVVTGIFTIKINDAFALIWEFLDLHYENATYVFKVDLQNYEMIVDRLKMVIATRSGVRAALNASDYRSRQNNQEALLDKFRRGLGYVANFKIKRGDKGAFSLWKKRLDSKLSLATPITIDEREWEYVFGTLRLDGSRKWRGGPAGRNTKKSGKSKSGKTEDEKVKTATPENEKIFNSSDNIVYTASQPGSEKIRELNGLLNTLLTNDIAT